MRIYERVTPPEKALRAQEAKQQFDWQAFDGERHPPDGLLVVARLDVPASCGQPTWAQMANVPRPDFVLPVSADGRLKQQALKLFRHLPQYQEIQQNFREGFYDQTKYVRPKARYWDTYRRKFLNVSLFQFPATDVGYVIVQAENGDDPGCMTGNYPHWTLSALWKIRRVGTSVKFEFLRYLSGTTAEGSEALTNMDGLEQPAILVSHGMLHRLRGNTLEEDIYPLAPELPECMN